MIDDIKIHSLGGTPLAFGTILFALNATALRIEALI